LSAATWVSTRVSVAIETRINTRNATSVMVMSRAKPRSLTEGVEFGRRGGMTTGVGGREGTVRSRWDSLPRPRLRSETFLELPGAGVIDVHGGGEVGVIDVLGGPAADLDVELEVGGHVADAVVFEFGDLLAVHEPGEFAGFQEQAEDVVAVGGGAVVDLRGAPLLVVGAVAVPVHGDAVAAGAPLGEDFHDVDFHGAVAGVAALPLVQPGVGAAVGHHPVGGPEAADVGDLDAGLEVTVELAPLVVALNE